MALPGADPMVQWLVVYLSYPIPTKDIAARSGCVDMDLILDEIEDR